MSAAVALHNVTVRYDGLVALDNVSLSLPYGQALGIVGPNGSGKSTLLKTIAGLLAPAQGELDVLGMAPKRLPAGWIAYVPQVEAVDWTFPASVWDVVAMGRFARLGMFNRFSADDGRAVQDALKAVHMEDLASRHISQLSGGQQQRVFVARAVAAHSRLLLLDEPTTGVDAETEENLRVVVRGLVADGMPVIMTTHDLDRAQDWFDRLMVVDRRVLADGNPGEVLASGAYAAIREHAHTHGHSRADATVSS